MPSSPLGPLGQIRGSHYESVRGKLSSQNIYRSTVRIRQLLRWLELVNQGGLPTERLNNLWINVYDTARDSYSPKPSIAEKSGTTSLTPVKDIYVGNLDSGATEQEIQGLFGRVGVVVSVAMPKDYLTGGQSWLRLCTHVRFGNKPESFRRDQWSIPEKPTA